VNARDENHCTLIHCAAQNNLKKVAKICIRRGGDINARNRRGQTALHFAYSYGFTELADYLISKGADDTILNNDGLTCYEGLSKSDLDRL